MTLVGLEYLKNQENERHNKAMEQSAAADRTSREGIATADRTSREQIASLDRSSKESISSLDRESKEGIARKDRETKERTSNADRIQKAQQALMEDDTKREIAGATGIGKLAGDFLKVVGKLIK